MAGNESSKKFIREPWFGHIKEDDVNAALNAFSLSIKNSMDICFPVCIVDYDRATRIAKVLPLHKYMYMDGLIKYENRPIFDVIIGQMTHGGITFDFPLNKGDTGYLISVDREVAMLKTEGALSCSVLEHERDDQVLKDEYPQEPSTEELHSMREGIFIPDCWGEFQGERMKDFGKNNLGIPEGALYLGTRFDTKDRYQNGDHYEKNSSCSLTMTPGFAEEPSVLAIASSRSLEDGEHMEFRFHDGETEFKACKNEGENEVRTTGEISADGVSIERENKDGDKASCSMTDDGIVIENLPKNGDPVRITIKDGEVTVSAKKVVFSSDVEFSGKVDLGNDITALGSSISMLELEEGKKVLGTE